MRFVSLLSAVFAGLIIAGCTSVYRDGGAANLALPASAQSPEYFTQYSVSNERVSAAGEAAVVLGLFQVSEGKYCLWNEDPNSSFADKVSRLLSPTQICIDNAKKAAVFNAVSSKSADLLLGATYEYTVHSYFFHTGVTCTVKGYPATVKGVKIPEKRPVILNKWQKLEYVDSETQLDGVGTAAPHTVSVKAD